jgi:glucose-6-phosphate isomerase
MGVLIALFERAVGLYASLVGINAYHQPGVEAGKTAATAVIALQATILANLRNGGKGSPDEIAAALHADPETVHHILRHLAANPEHGIRADTTNPETRYST